MSFQQSSRIVLNHGRRSLAPVVTLTCAWAIAGVAVLPRIDWSHLQALTLPDNLAAVEVLLRSANPPLDGLVLTAEVLFTAVWVWVGASLAIEAALALLDATSLRGAALAV